MLDGIETELENNSLLKAIQDDSTIKLPLVPYEELSEYETKHPALTADQLLDPKPHVRKYFFQQFLRVAHDEEMYDFLKRVDYYERSHAGERWEKALDLYNAFFAASGAKLEKKASKETGSQAGSRAQSPSFMARKSSRENASKSNPSSAGPTPGGTPVLGPGPKLNPMGMVQLSLPSSEEKGSRNKHAHQHSIADTLLLPTANGTGTSTPKRVTPPATPTLTAHPSPAVAAGTALTADAAAAAPMVPMTILSVLTTPPPPSNTASAAAPDAATTASSTPAVSQHGEYNLIVPLFASAAMEGSGTSTFLSSTSTLSTVSNSHLSTISTISTSSVSENEHKDAGASGTDSLVSSIPSPASTSTDGAGSPGGAVGGGSTLSTISETPSPSSHVGAGGSGGGAGTLSSISEHSSAGSSGSPSSHGVNAVLLHHGVGGGSSSLSLSALDAVFVPPSSASSAHAHAHVHLPPSPSSASSASAASGSTATHTTAGNPSPTSAASASSSSSSSSSSSPSHPSAAPHGVPSTTSLASVGSAASVSAISSAPAPAPAAAPAAAAAAASTVSGSAASAPQHHHPQHSSVTLPPPTNVHEHKSSKSDNKVGGGGSHTRNTSRGPSRANSNFNLLGGSGTGVSNTSVISEPSKKESKVEKIEGVREQVLALKHAVEGPTMPDHSLFHPILAKVKVYLNSKTLPVFKASEQYRRYIQIEHYREKKVIVLDDFRQFRVLGRGSFGQVFAVQKIDTHAIFAMKEMDKRMVKNNECEHMVVNEQQILSQMSSPFVLGLRYSFHEPSRLFLIFDLCTGGDIKYHMRRQEGKKFSNDRAKFYAAEMLLGLEAIHAHDYVYRDLKPHNVLLTKEGHVKISDLGLTLKIKPGRRYPFLGGTSGYWSPEVLSCQDTFKVSDFWSFGVCLYEMLCGKLPSCSCDHSKKGDSVDWCTFGASDQEELNALKKNGNMRVAVNLAKPELNSDAVDLITRLLTVNPKLRLGANGAQEIKQHPYFADMDWDRLGALQVDPPFVPDEAQINAEEIADIGEFRKTKFNKIKVTQQEEAKWYEHFYYVNPDGLQDELVSALTKIDSKKGKPSTANEGCCVLL